MGRAQQHAFLGPTRSVTGKGAPTRVGFAAHRERLSPEHWPKSPPRDDGLRRSDRPCYTRRMPKEAPALAPAELAAAVARTLGHYDRVAEAFLEATIDHDVSQNYAALLDAIEGPPPYTLLDFGCGPGRDLARFRSMGHVAIGLDGSSRFVDMARARTGCEVWHQNFLELDLPPERFHGVFANASLFHVPRQELGVVLRKLALTLVPRGVLFSSNPWGADTEGTSDERYGAFHSLETWRAEVTRAGFVELTHYYRPSGKPRHEQPWLATVWRKGDR
jgi:SAM-dependent methyltransferase